MALKTGLELRVYKTYAKAAGELVAVLTDQVSACVASTAVHGGFRQLRFRLSLSLAEAWSWLNHEGGPGRHFYHAELSHGRKLAWEDRIMDVTLALEGGSFLGVDVVCYGYWSSLRDQVYNDNSIDSGSTDWTVGGPHTADEIVKERLTDKCPDISSDQSNISANSQDLLGITFRDDDYPMDIIVDTLAPGNPDGDENVYYFGVWESRVPYWSKRAVSPVDYYVWLEDLSHGSFVQSGHDLRNRVLTKHLVDGGTTRTAKANDTDSQARYPVRELVVSQGEINATNAVNARDQALAEQKLPPPAAVLHSPGARLVRAQRHPHRAAQVGGARRQGGPRSGLGPRQRQQPRLRRPAHLLHPRHRVRRHHRHAESAAGPPGRAGLVAAGPADARGGAPVSRVHPAPTCESRSMETAGHLQVQTEAHMWKMGWNRGRSAWSLPSAAEGERMGWAGRENQPSVCPPISQSAIQ